MDTIKPNTIKYSVGLLWLSASLTLLLAFAMLLNLFPFTVNPSDTVPGFITAFFIGLCSYNIGKGRNWAKWLFLLVCVLGALMFPLVYFFAPHQIVGMPKILQISGFVQFILQTTAIVLIFLKPSRNFFIVKTQNVGITSNNTLN